MSNTQNHHKESFGNSTSEADSIETGELNPKQTDGSEHEVRYDKFDIDAKIAKVKMLVYEGLCKQKHLYNPKDVYMFFEKPEYNYPMRFLERVDMNVSKAAEMIASTAKWRNQKGLSDLDDTSFPKMAYLYGFAFIYGKDVQGSLVLHIRYKLLCKFDRAVADMLELFTLYLGFKIDQLSSVQKKGWIIVIDFTGVKAKNWNMNYTLNLLKACHYYTPSGLKAIFTYGLHRMLNPLMKILTKLLPVNTGKLLIPLDKESLLEHISKDNLPRYLGGTCENDPREVPKGCPDDEEYFCQKYNLQSLKFKEIEGIYHAIMRKTEW